MSIGRVGPAIALLLATNALNGSAQVVHGTIRTTQANAIVPNAKVTALDSVDKVLAETSSDATGRFVMVLTHAPTFRVTVRKIGWKPSATDWLHAASADTLDLQLQVPADPLTLEPVEVTGVALRSFTDRALDEARRRGWKLIGPETVAAHREAAFDFLEMLRAVQAPGLMIPYRPNDCIRSIRTRRCLTYILDGVPSGSQLYVNPRDVYFIAVLSATESAVQWGDKAPWGAIVIYTRMNGDPKNP